MISHCTTFRQCISVEYLAIEKSCERAPGVWKRREERGNPSHVAKQELQSYFYGFGFSWLPRKADLKRSVNAYG